MANTMKSKLNVLHRFLAFSLSGTTLADVGTRPILSNDYEQPSLFVTEIGFEKAR